MQRRLAMAILLWLAETAAAQVPGPIANAMQFARQGRYQEAERILKSYAEQNPNNAEAYEALGQLYYHFGYYAAAEPVFEKALELMPNDRPARILDAVCLFKIGETAKAEAAARKLLAENPPPNDIDLSLTYARYLYENHDLAGALAQTKAAVAFAPDHPIGFFAGADFAE